MNKKKKEQPSELERTLADCRRYYIRTPQIQYEVGQRVIHGNVDISHVTQVLDGGKILVLHETCTNHNYGRPYQYERDMAVIWNQVIPHREWEKDKYILQERTHLQYSQRDIYGLVHMHYCFGIDMDPKYQRGLVWTDEDKEKLIESIFQQVDIGKFVLAHRKYAQDTEGYEIIDGKQRLNALLDFKEGIFTWRNLKYWDLHPRDRSFFDMYPISVAELMEPSQKQILECFVRCNTSGKPQDAKHLETVKEMLAAL